MVAAVTLVALGAVAPAGAETITGRLIDKACYERNPKNVGQKHVRKPVDECASTCIRFGLPAAVLTDAGTVYHIAGDLTKNRNAALLPHVTQRVRVQGEVSTDKDGGLVITAREIAPLK
jgi:hypothetical protein